MKLYATITSERATKGQGGNHFIDIKLTYELDGERLHYGGITLSESGVLTFIHPDGTVKTISILRDIHYTTKGNKQKDEKLCPQCNEPIWDVAKGHKLNKCWDCNLAFD